jgi:prepilin-type N-terminal cleavage/methylation domain-containing protein
MFDGITQRRSLHGARGFSALELLIVVLIALIVVAIAIPNMLTVIANTRLRGNICTLSGALQNCRMYAVNRNLVMTTRYTSDSYGIKAYIKKASDSSGATTTDYQVQLEAPIVHYTTPSGTGAPSALTTTELGFTPNTGDTSFNTRGLPCAYSAGSCPNKGFVYYFKDTRRSGSSGWAAVSVSPAGRIKRWFWTGTAWGD